MHQRNAEKLELEKQTAIQKKKIEPKLYVHSKYNAEATKTLPPRTGLKNKDKESYINSILQVFFSIQEVGEFLKSNQLCGEESCWFEEIKDIGSILLNPRITIPFIWPNGLIEKIQKTDPVVFPSKRENNAFDFWMGLVDKLKEKSCFASLCEQIFKS